MIEISDSDRRRYFMATCVFCGNPTEFNTSRTPVCLDCDKHRHRPPDMKSLKTTDRVRQVLQDEVTAAKQRLDVSAARFDEVIQEIPSGIPHSDGAQRIWHV